MTACGDGGGNEGGPEYGQASPRPINEFVFAVHPLHNPARMTAIYGPIIDRLNEQNPGLHFRFEASHDYAAFELKLSERQVHFALPNPYQTLRCRVYGYRIFGKMGDDDHFRGIILVRQDSGIRTIQDLKGKSISYPAPTALAATMMPQYYLQTHGLDVVRDTRSHYVRTQESVIMNVYLKLTDAGATWPVPWIAFCKDHPEEAKALVARWQTEALPNNGLVVRDDVSEPVVRRVEQVIFSLHLDPDGQKLLAQIPLSRFEPASDRTYAPVQVFLKQFEGRVRPLDP
jgi:phosphonate transport system substrate-binding protein